MTPIVSGLVYIDLQFLGYPSIIATAVLHGPSGVALVDPGPATAGDRLVEELSRQGVPLSDVTDVLVTHIHLDHSGGVGQLVRFNPKLRVHVHEAGARRRRCEWHHLRVRRTTEAGRISHERNALASSKKRGPRDPHRAAHSRRGPDARVRASV